MIKENNYAIDLLKILFLLFIILHHSGQMSSILIRGYIGVEFFFIVSGYLLMMTKENNKDLSTVNYIKRRIYKLYPHYFLSFIVMYISTTLYRTGDLTFKQVVEAVPEMFMIQNIGIFNGGLNFPCWYLSVLIWASIFIYGLSRIISRRLFNILSACTITVIYVYVAMVFEKIETFSTIGIFYLPFWRGIAGMLLGCIIFRISDVLNRKLYSKYQISIQICEIALLVTITLLLFVKGSLDFIVIICISALVLLVLNPDSLLNKLGDNSLIKWLSRYEYAIFLNHAFVICTYNKVIRDNIDFAPIINIVLILIILIVYSFITQYIIDVFKRNIFKSSF